jgi:hypothetical protein
MVARLTQEMLERLAEAALALAIVVGSAFLWIGIPLGGFWLAGELTASAEGFLFAVLGGVPIAMVAFGWPPSAGPPGSSARARSVESCAARELPGRSSTWP